jgi:dihydrofolate reductase
MHAITRYTNVFIAIRVGTDGAAHWSFAPAISDPRTRRQPAHAMTRRLIMWNLVTLEGFFEGPNKWDLDWHEHVWGDELQRFSLEQQKTTDALLFGRVTYEGMAAHWSTAKGATAEFMNSVPKVVFSRTLDRAQWNNTRLVREDAAAEVAKLKNAPGQNLYVFGSAELSATLMQHDLFDEYRLCVVPVVLGAGTPLFKASAERKRMTVREARRLNSGGVILFCEPERR